MSTTPHKGNIYNTSQKGKNKTISLNFLLLNNQQTNYPPMNMLRYWLAIFFKTLSIVDKKNMANKVKIFLKKLIKFISGNKKHIINNIYQMLVVKKVSCVDKFFFKKDIYID